MSQKHQSKTLNGSLETWFPYFVRSDWRECAGITIGNHGSVKLSYDLWQFRRILVDLALSVTATIDFLCFYIYDPATAGEVKGPGMDVVRGADGGALAAPGDLPRSRPAGYITLIGQSKHHTFSLSSAFFLIGSTCAKQKKKAFFLNACSAVSSSVSSPSVFFFSVYFQISS